MSKTGRIMDSIMMEIRFDLLIFQSSLYILPLKGTCETERRVLRLTEAAENGASSGQGKEPLHALLDRAAERVEEYRLQGYHCSESSIRAVADVLHIPLSDDILRISSGFRGGGGGYMERCGILESGIILISYLYGRVEAEESVYVYSYLIRKLHEMFLQEMGSYTCRVLLPFSMRNTSDRSCAYTYHKGVRILTRLLAEADELIRDMPEKEKKRLMVSPIPSSCE